MRQPRRGREERREGRPRSAAAFVQPPSSLCRPSTPPLALPCCTAAWYCVFGIARGRAGAKARDKLFPQVSASLFPLCPSPTRATQPNPSNNKKDAATAVLVRDREKKEAGRRGKATACGTHSDSLTRDLHSLASCCCVPLPFSSPTRSQQRLYDVG